MPRTLPPRASRTLLALSVAAVLVLLLLSHQFGRAVPTNNYRPLITVDAIESGCYPLPGGATFGDLSYQVRWDTDVDTDVGPRRHLFGQYNLVEQAEARRLLVAAFEQVGFVETEASEAGGTMAVQLRKGEEVVGLLVRELPDTSEETLVRGEFDLDLPVQARASNDPICDQETSTKRFGGERP